MNLDIYKMRKRNVEHWNRLGGKRWKQCTKNRFWYEGNKTENDLIDSLIRNEEASYKNVDIWQQRIKLFCSILDWPSICWQSNTRVVMNHFDATLDNTWFAWDRYQLILICTCTESICEAMVRKTFYLWKPNPLMMMERSIMKES